MGGNKKDTAEQDATNVPSDRPTKPSPEVLAGSRAEPADAKEPDFRDAAKPDEPEPTSGHKILIVDDDPDLRLSIRDVLEEHNFNVEEARDGADAIGQLFTIAPMTDVILLDMAMPNVDGMAFLRMFHQSDWLGIPIVVVTGVPPVRAKITELTEDKHTYVLGKPIDYDLLVQIVTQLVDERRAARRRARGEPSR